ncbi:hypothetical protein IHE71_20680, partial [Myceligenerans sp. TRM 65318]|nr:hypothetical protein [Myceligenerans sp. TRM 65318]MBE3020381.1 hypothetical protein [Myceligenerans sp. TRM 65318]
GEAAARAAARADAPAEVKRDEKPQRANASAGPSPASSAEAGPEPTPTPAANDAGANAGRADASERAPAAPLRFPAKSAQAAREASWDPCKLLHPGALGSFGTASIDSDRGEFQKCHVTVADGESAAEVELTMFTGEDPDGDVADQHDGVTVYSAESDGECTRDVVFGPEDRYTFSFEASHVEGSGTDLCDLVQSVADRAVADVAADDIPVRTAEPLPGSAIGRSTCALPSDGALRTALNLDDVVGPRREFAEWDCMWDGDDGRDLRLLFQRDEGYDPDDGTRFSASGHTAYERGDHWEDGCLVDVVAQRGPSPEGDGPVSELLRIHLTGESDRDTLCDDAMEVARSAASSL